MLCLTVMEWEDNKIKIMFAQDVNENYKNLDSPNVIDQVNKLIKTLR